MEENFNNAFDEVEQEEKENKKNKKSVMATLSMLFPIASLCLIVILAIIAGFTPIYVGVLFGIMNLVILALPIAGGILAYLDKKDLKSTELLLNIATIMVALICF